MAKGAIFYLSSLQIVADAVLHTQRAAFDKGDRRRHVNALVPACPGPVG